MRPKSPNASISTTRQNMMDKNAANKSKLFQVIEIARHIHDAYLGQQEKLDDCIKLLEEKEQNEGRLYQEIDGLNDHMQE